LTIIAVNCCSKLQSIGTKHCQELDFSSYRGANALGKLNVPIANFINSGRRKYLYFVFLLCLLTVAIVPMACRQSSAKKTSITATEILWDKWGVPHIFAPHGKDTFYAFGWAQTHSHANLLLRLYGQARGRAAEYWGEKYRGSDRWVLTNEVPQRAAIWYQQQTPEFQGYLQAFAQGINDYATAHPAEIDPEMRTVLPIQPVDILAHTQRVIHFNFVTGPFVIQQPSIPLVKESQALGSNAWAIAPPRAQNNHSLLMINPHLPWSDLFIFYEAHIVQPGGEMYGATLVGMPVIAIGFNDNLGWSHTVNTYDGQDLYRLTPRDQGYLFDGQVREFETTQYTMKIKQLDGSYREEPLTVKKSVHGPVISEKDGEVLALRVAGLEHPKILEEWWQMGQARSLAEFETAMSQLQLPLFNVVYADKKGNIMYLYNGLVPRRKKGDWNFWQQIVPGEDSSTLWTDYLTFAELPRVVNPTSHWVQNANDPPWFATFPEGIKPEKYPAYLSPNILDLRPQSSIKAMLSKDSVSLDDLIDFKHSTHAELADRLLPDLFKIAETSTNKVIIDAVAVLKKWDRRLEADSQGAVLFHSWVSDFQIFPVDSPVFRQRWEASKPLETPQGLADPQKALAGLEKAANSVQAAYKRLDVSWGEVARLRIGTQDLPINGGSGFWGVLRVVEYLPLPDHHLQAFFGDSFVAAVEFGPELHAKALLTYSNTSQPKSKQIGDQTALFSQKQLREVWLKRTEIEQNLEKHEPLKTPSQ
jgi:acyl-homoserine-lactone acylase